MAFRGGWVVGLLGITLSCGSDGSSAESFPGDLAVAFCGRFVECMSASVEQRADCESQLTKAYGDQLDPTIALVREGKASFNADKARACLDGVRSLTCDVAGSATLEGMTVDRLNSMLNAAGCSSVFRRK
jgi:hypothetical protein